MRTIATLVTWVSAASFSLAATAAPSDPKRAAAELIDKGNRLMQVGDYDAALAYYRAAHGIYPAPKIYFNMAEASRELGKPVEAAAYFERFVNDAGVDQTSPFYKEANRRLSELLEKLGTVSITSPNEGTAVFVDGRTVGNVPIKELRLVPGQHDIVLEKPGFARKTLTLTVEAGMNRTFDVVLRSLAPDTTLRLAAPPSPPPDTEVGSLDNATLANKPPDVGNRSLTSRWWFWTLVAGGVAIAGATAIAISAGGEDFRLEGSLGPSSTSDWDPL